MKYTQLYSITPGTRPEPTAVETGEIWINIPDGVIGTKDAEDNIVELATNGDYIPKSGAVEGITSSPLAEVAESNSITIDDDAAIAIRYTLTATGATINCLKTTSDKAVKLTLVKPAGVTCTVTWQGVDGWLSTVDVPQFGESEEAQELCVAIFSSPTYTAVNTVYNTENPTEVDSSQVQWGQLYGDIAEQTDLADALAEKASVSELANYATLTGAAFTGAVTVQEPTTANNPATKSYVDSAVASVYKYKGSVANTGALPSSSNAVGDVYNVEDTGDNYAWDGSKWDKLAGTVDLNGYLTTANASQTYLTKAEASSIYATTTSLNEAVSNAQATYQVKGDYATNTALAAKADASALANYLTLAGGTLTGNLTAPTFIGALQGNASTASALATARTISVTGDASGSTTFNGSANAAITLTVSHAAAADSATTAAACTGNAATATKATQDANGNVINTTYATVTALNELIARVTALETSTVKSTGNNTITGTLTIA